MGRKRSFDHEEVVLSAMRAFWRLGFRNTGIRELERATGLKGPSLYHAFGSKEGLFVEALGTYVDRVGTLFVAPLEEDGAGIDAVGAMFRALRVGMAGEEALPGCLVIEAVPIELERAEAAQGLVDAYRDRFVAAFRACLARDRIDAPHAADTLWLLTVALNHTHRSRGLGAELDAAFAAVDSFLESLAGRAGPG